MFAKIPEKYMHRVRWLLALGWLFIIASLFYDPISPWLTQPETTWSPFTIDKITQFDCVMVQGQCLEEKPFAMGAAFFWGMIVPAGVFILMVGGHELWRRICPLSFLSQIPRAMGWQRHRKKVDKKTGKTRLELVKVDKNSWLGRNHLYLQLGLFYVGISSRILFVNSNRLVLGLFLTGTILASMLVGYLFGGKSWCQYFCPMAPVQKIYGEPRGLLNSTAHEGDRQLITQSMCRTITPEGKEKSACVACNTPCMDIDAERTYWDNVTKPEQQWLHYGYFGLTIGYFVYYYLYAGNWEYYMSGSWAHEENQLANLFNPGFFFFGQAIPIPKLIAVPLTIGLFGLAGYWLGRFLEKRYKGYLLRRHKLVNNEVVRHRMFALGTFVIFNFFFIFGGRNFVRMLPLQLQYLFPVLMAVCSGIWIYRTWPRNPYLYQRESLANRLRKQLSKLKLNVEQFLEGRSLDDLHADEVYVLAKILPGFDKEKRIQAYKGIVKETLGEGYVDVQNSLESLRQVRLELDISDQEHDLVLTELEVENPSILETKYHKNHEDWLRQESYRQALLDTITESSKDHPHQGIILDLYDIMTGEKSIESFEQVLSKLSDRELELIKGIREEYSITPEEEKEILTHSNPHQLWQTMSYTLSAIEHLDAIAQGKEGVACNLVPIDPSQMMFYEQTFKKFDKDGNNSLSVVELHALLRAVGRSYSPDRLQEVMDMMTGRVNSDSITFAEFTNLIHSTLSEPPEDAMRQRFRFFDMDGSGNISLEELRLCLRDIDTGLSDSDIEEMLKLADTSGDNELSYEEFREIFGQFSTSVSHS
ncbi:MAG: EF-hand domain-containing protein [Crocosphaera sp.]|nr:EF-hand domain-containing protein [Crocosphaera sp.]